MTQLSSGATQTPRFDIYAIIHKTLRAFMCDTLTTVASMDVHDEAEVAAALAQLRELVAFCASHLQHENDFVHAAMEARRPGSSALTAGDHEHHAWAVKELLELADAVLHDSGLARRQAAAELQRYLALFVAENFTHMNIEESENNAVLWATHNDEELHAIEQAIVASIKPEQMALSMRWMIPAMNASERAQKLGGIRQGAPAPVFDAILGIAQANLTNRDWDKLARALALPVRLAA